jgi:hypothetical protein
MTRSMKLLAAGIVAFAPSAAFAQTQPPGQGQYNGSGYWHTNGPTSTGQPDADCEELGTTPGNSSTAAGGGSPFSGEESTGGSHYAGSQPQNSRNSASVSIYDVACQNQTNRLNR